MYKSSYNSLIAQLCTVLAWMVVVSLSSGCVYTIAANVDVGGGRVDKDAYALQRTGVSLGGHFIKTPVSLDLKFNRESGQSLGDGDLDKKFFQDHNVIGLGLWLPNDSGWEPYLHVEGASNDFLGLKHIERKYFPMSSQNEIAVGLRRAFPRGEKHEGCFSGYTIEGFASRGDIRAQDANGTDIMTNKKITTVGLRLTGFVDALTGLPGYWLSSSQHCIFK